MKVIYIILGFLFFTLGAVGVVLPILPTTPFLLVAAFCFAKGSDKVNNWFLQTKLYKKHLESFNKDRSMTLQTKLSILLFASIMLLSSLYFMHNIYGRVTVILVIMLKYWYFLYRIKTKPKKM